MVAMGGDWNVSIDYGHQKPEIVVLVNGIEFSLYDLLHEAFGCGDVDLRDILPLLVEADQQVTDEEFELDSFMQGQGEQEGGL